MADVPGGTSFARHAPKIAIGAAVAALSTSLVAVIVVTSRGPAPSHGATGAISGATTGATSGATPQDPPSAPGRPVAPPLALRVPASAVAELEREHATAPATEPGIATGVKVTDAELRTRLGLIADDIITAVAGHTIRRRFDLFEVLESVARLESSNVYVDLVRAGRPGLVRWQLDGSLRTARTRSRPPKGPPGPPDPADPSDPSDPSDPIGPAGPTGVLGSLASVRAIDPVIATIEEVSDSHYRIPRATLDRVLASPATYAQRARVMPAYQAGRPNGVRLFGARPGGLAAALGMQNGDTIHSLGGEELRAIEDVPALLQKFPDVKVWRVELTRRGSAETLILEIQ